MKNKESGKNKFPVGSAFILAVVLTTLLAIVGTMFLMAARVNKMSTSAISENRELNFAVETIIAKISQELVLDTPGIADQEYYDYPGTIDKWLASPEPYEESARDYRWRQISDVTGFLDRKHYETQEVDVEPVGLKTSVYVREYPQIRVDSKGRFLDKNGNVATKGVSADADGDGIADSKWISLDDITSSKGKHIYAAIRIVDNCGMINLNTAYKFDEADANLVDGSSQLQINLMALAKQPGQAPDTTDETKLLETRVNYDVSDIDPEDLDEYKEDVIWRYNRPEGEYTPFDISDELEMRNRFVLNHPDIITRIEELWDKTFQGGKEVPFDSNMSDWFDMAQYDASGSGDDYSYRHIATTYNMDRIIDPNGDNGDVRKMININEETDVEVLYETLVNSIDTNIDNDDRKEIKKRYAQLAANLADFADDNAEVTVFDPTDADIDDTTYYGFEAQPFITEVGMIVGAFPESGRNYFAVELYNPFKERIHLEDFELLVVDSDGGTVDPERSIKFSNDDWIESERCFVIVSNKGKFDIYNETNENTMWDPNLTFFGGWKPADESKPPIDYRPPEEIDESKPPIYIGWTRDSTLLLKRNVNPTGTEEWIYVDKQVVDRRWGATSRGRYFERDVRDWHIVYQTLERDTSETGRLHVTLGIRNDIDPDEFRDRDHDFSFFLPNPIKKEIITVGDIPQILTIGPPEVDSYSNNTIGEQLQRTGKDNEDQIRLDLQNPYHRNIFQYLTVFDPADHGRGNKATRVKGRININTAPWYVIAQLPWVSDELAQAIVAYRDKLKLGVAADIDYSGDAGRYYALRKVSNTSFNFNNPDDIREEAGFASIGELNFAIAGSDDKYSIQKNALDNKDLDDFPDLTRDGSDQGDGIKDDFEERDVIFSRISNLVTVRSDVFTAYILIRIGVDGPQKRAVAILDRSRVNSPDDKVRIVALHYVPDPR